MRHNSNNALFAQSLYVTVTNPVSVVTRCGSKHRVHDLLAAKQDPRPAGEQLQDCKFPDRQPLAHGAYLHRFAAHVQCERFELPDVVFLIH